MTEQGMEDRHGLQSGLKRRHVTMIALGGANPSTGSFADYSRMSLGNWAGFTAGWLYSASTSPTSWGSPAARAVWAS